jgi:hypothetical protein
MGTDIKNAEGKGLIEQCQDHANRASGDCGKSTFIVKHILMSDRAIGRLLLSDSLLYDQGEMEKSDLCEQSNCRDELQVISDETRFFEERSLIRAE